MFFAVGCTHRATMHGNWTEQFKAPATIRTAEDVRLAQDEFDAAASSSRRNQLRDQIEEYLARQIDFTMAAKQVDESRDLFMAVLRNYRGVELEHPGANPRLLRLAQHVEGFFRPRGRTREVLAALSVQIAFQQDTVAVKNRFREISDWICGGGVGDINRSHVIHYVEHLEEISRNFPSPFVVQELLEKYRTFLALPAASADSGDDELRPVAMPSPLRFGRRAFAEISLLLRVPAIARAIEIARQDAALPGDDALLRHLLEQADQSAATDADWLTLSEYFAQQDNLDIMLASNIVQEGIRRFPRSWSLHLWAGRYAIVMNRLHAAIVYFEAAVELEPMHWGAWEPLAKLYEVALVRIASQDNVDVNVLEGIFRRVRRIYALALAHFPNKTLSPSEDELRFQVVRGYYHAGKLSEAQRELAKMAATSRHPRVNDLQAQIALRLEQPRDVRSALDGGETKIAALKPAEQAWWQAKFQRLRAESYEQEKDIAHATAARRAALASWAKVMQELNPEALAEAHTERARLLYGLGQRAEAVDAIRIAIDAAPDRATTYADMIAFLVIRGELVSAEEIFHRIAARSEMTDYLKVYCSLWISDLAERQKQPVDAMALAYLKSVRGSEWFHDLASWATGELDDAQLAARADTPAKRTELAFYQGLRAYRRGRKADAVRLWQQVIHSRLVAFFEYDMAGFYLRLGEAPDHPLLPAATVVPTTK